MEKPAIQTTHNLEFEVAPSKYGMLYRVGSCHGQWMGYEDCYCILSVINDYPGNGHLNDVFEWFEHSCKRDGKNLLILECFNEGFYEHLIKKRGFVPLDKERCNVVKIFNKNRYKKMLRKGNEVLHAKTLKTK